MPQDIFAKLAIEEQVPSQPQDSINEQVYRKFKKTFSKIALYEIKLLHKPEEIVVTLFVNKPQTPTSRCNVYARFSSGHWFHGSAAVTTPFKYQEIVGLWDLGKSLIYREDSNDKYVDAFLNLLTRLPDQNWQQHIARSGYSIEQVI